MAGFGGSAVRLSDLFLFTGTSTVSSSIILEVMSFEVSEASKLGELDMLDFSSVTADGFVQVDDLGVRKGKGTKKLKEVFGVLLEIKGVMGESTEDSGRCGIPGNGPIAVGLDSFRGLATPNREVKISNGSGDLVIGESGEETGENDVNVDRHS